MLTGGFNARKFPKRHDHVVEACRALDVREYLATRTDVRRGNAPFWLSGAHPGLTLLPQLGGPFLRQWFACPRCHRRRETLYTPPGAADADWRCRVCWGLVYASQRYGYRHPLRRKLTPRKRVTALKRALRRRRLDAQQLARCKAPSQPTAPLPPVPPLDMTPFAQGMTLELSFPRSVVGSGVPPVYSVRWVSPAERVAEAEARAAAERQALALHAKVTARLSGLAEQARTPAERNQVARLLRKAGQPPADSSPPSQPWALSREDLQRIRQGLALDVDDE